ncbi:unnamed protein product [Ceutorhynchus assimilis]|uniref:Uncharacterized protein n=1 Tax=Ceutorhynchus assimilis TaxID=467358 RepID=A0A9N9MTY5_9CUCU|nr:unnamed protein product [Ceutorhynchus assimilis]
MECVICEETKSKEVFNCDGCRNPICKSCGGLSASEVKVMELRGKRVMRFNCPRCINLETCKLLQDVIDSKNANIDDKVEIISMLKTQIEELKKTNENKNTYDYAEKSYAGVTSRPPAKDRLNIPNLIIRPKQIQDVTKTKEDITKKINPSELNIGIRGMRATGNGNIVIKCPTKQEVEDLKRAAESVLQNKYEIITTTMMRPKIKIPGYEGNEPKQQIEQIIRNQNEWINDTDEIKMKFDPNLPTKVQDTVHISTKLKTRMLNEKISLQMGDKKVSAEVSANHLKTLIETFSKDKHMLCASHLQGTDKMNFEAINKMASDNVIQLRKIPDAEATLQYLLLTRCILNSFLAKDITLERRVYLVCQPCEKFFRQARAMSSKFSTIVNFSLLEMLRRLKRIQALQEISADLGMKFTFPRVGHGKLGVSSAVPVEFPSEEEIKFILEKSKNDARNAANSSNMLVETSVETDVCFEKMPIVNSTENATKNLMIDEEDSEKDTEGEEITIVYENPDSLKYDADISLDISDKILIEKEMSVQEFNYETLNLIVRRKILRTVTVQAQNLKTKHV